MDIRAKRMRIVVKIGSSSLTNQHGGLSQEKLSAHVNAIAALIKEGHEAVLVSSGAVAAGFTLLGYPTRPVTVEGKQAAAAVGQGILIQAYMEEFRKHRLLAAQILLTRQDFTKREQYRNAFNTLSVLLKKGAVPIINENDTVSADELAFGDNDMLSALVAGLLHADLLIILTDTDGLFDADPRTCANAKKLTRIPEITPAIERLAGGSGSKLGTGGMKSKIAAAKLALSLGVPVYVGRGEGGGKLKEIAGGRGSGTYFGHPGLDKVKAKKQWIAFLAETKGRIVVDPGAEEALLAGGRSLLPTGVKEVVGDFQPGDVVEVLNGEGELLGKGQVNYSAEQLRLAKGNSSDYALQRLKVSRAEVIHRDDWIGLRQNREKEVMI